MDTFNNVFSAREKVEKVFDRNIIYLFVKNEWCIFITFKLSDLFIL